MSKNLLKLMIWNDPSISRQSVDIIMIPVHVWLTFSEHASYHLVALLVHRLKCCYSSP